MTLTSRQQTIQNQINALDSASSTSTMLNLLTLAVNEGGIRWGYDSNGVFPTEESDFIGMIALDDNDSDLWIHGQDLQWHKIDSAASV